MADKKANRYPYFAAETSAEVVIARIGADVDPRFREIMTAVIRHLHALVKEVRLTDDEWMAAIQFLTKTGQMCTDWRQEFILLSDTLGRQHAGRYASTIVIPRSRRIPSLVHSMSPTRLTMRTATISASTARANRWSFAGA